MKWGDACGIGLLAALALAGCEPEAIKTAGPPNAAAVDREDAQAYAAARTAARDRVAVVEAYQRRRALSLQAALTPSPTYTEVKPPANPYAPKAEAELRIEQGHHHLALSPQAKAYAAIEPPVHPIAPAQPQAPTPPPAEPLVPCAAVDNALRTAAACVTLTSKLAPAKVLFNDPDSPSPGQKPARILVGAAFHEVLTVVPPGQEAAGQAAIQAVAGGGARRAVPGAIDQASVSGGALEDVTIRPTDDFTVEANSDTRQALIPGASPPVWDFTITPKSVGARTFTVEVTPVIYENGEAVKAQVRAYAHIITVSASSFDVADALIKSWTTLVGLLAALVAVVLVLVTRAWRLLGPLWRAITNKQPGR